MSWPPATLAGQSENLHLWRCWRADKIPQANHAVREVSETLVPGSPAQDLITRTHPGLRRSRNVVNRSGSVPVRRAGRGAEHELECRRRSHYGESIALARSG